jgi:ribonuclease-3
MSAFESFHQPDLTAEEQQRLDDLAVRLAITFRRPSLLREAMTHASWNNERGAPAGPGHDNERLEYLGDAVLELVAGENLFKRFPGHDEGQLTQLRAALVNTLSLAKLAERLGLGDTLLLGKGAAKTGARQLPSLLANSFEAMIGAIFLDQGYRVATRVFLQSIGDLAEWSDENHKGKLQELAQERFSATPGYRVSAVGGPGHRREYRADAVVGGRVLGEGRGGTKQAAEQAAARQALERLRVSAPAPVARPAAGVPARPAPSPAPSAESVRVRRRVAEVAADRGAGAPGTARGRLSPAAPAAPVEPARRHGLLGIIRGAAGALTGRRPEPEPVPEPEPEPEPRKHTRRGHRGGRGRHRPSPPSTPPT